MENASRSQKTIRQASRRGHRQEDTKDLSSDDLLDKRETNQATSDTEQSRTAGVVATVVQFEFGPHQVRSVMLNDETWFVAADVCAVLDHSDTSKAVSRLDDDEKGATTVRTLGGEQRMNVISQSGLFALVLTSRKPEAKAFRRWITGVVLPLIRRTGRYEVGSENAAPTNSPGAGAVLVKLPGHGRFIVTALPDAAALVRQTPLSEMIEDATALDCQAMGCALGSIEAFWQKVQQMQSIGKDPTGGFAMEQLDRAIRDGAYVGRHYLYQYSMRPREIDG